MLRPYQADIVEAARLHMRSGTRTILIQAPTGSGKTILTAHMLKSSAERGMAAFFIVHRRELVKQSTAAFRMVGVPHGIVANGFDENPWPLVQICSIGTLANRWHLLQKPKLIIWDEAHHCAAKGWSAIHQAFPDAFHIGLTATPERLDGTGLKTWFSKMVRGPSVSWLIANGFLAPYRLYAPSSVSMAGVHTRMGDYVKSELTDLMDRPSITGSAVREYQKLAMGKRAVAFCVSIKHSKNVVDQFNAAGIRAEHVDGETPVEDRDLAIRRFKNGEIKVLSNVDLFGEGFDLPSLESSILLRPTQSLTLFLQQVGRALRPSPGKDHAIILDHAGNCARHGLPDEDRHWTLEGRPRIGRAKAESNTQVKICPKCFAAQVPGPPACLYCFHVFEIKSRKIKHVDGELTQVDSKTFVRQARDIEQEEQNNCKEFEDLVELGKRRKYKRPYFWAKMVWDYRKRKKRKQKGSM